MIFTFGNIYYINIFNRILLKKFISVQRIKKFIERKRILLNTENFSLSFNREEIFPKEGRKSIIPVPVKNGLVVEETFGKVLKSRPPVNKEVRIIRNIALRKRRKGRGGRYFRF